MCQRKAKRCVCSTTYLGTIAAPHRERKELCGVLVTVQLHFRECSSMALDRLTDTAFPTVQLHGALDLERGRVG